MKHNIAFSLIAGLALAASVPAFADSDFSVTGGRGFPVSLNAADCTDHCGTFPVNRNRKFSSEYDTVLIQGMMPQAGTEVSLLLPAKDASGAVTELRPVKTYRTSSGRFWAKYLIPSKTGEAINFRMHPKRAGESITLYDVEAYKASDIKEETAPSKNKKPAEKARAFNPSDYGVHVISREEWGAKAPNGEYTEHSPNKFTLHHTAGNYPDSKEAAVEEMKFIQNMHMDGQGWTDIGYHFIIDPFGDIFEGRPVGVVGAHTYGANTDNIGISIMGYYHSPRNDVFTDASHNALVGLGIYIKDYFGIKSDQFFGHRDLGSTACPGDGIYALMETIRGEIFNNTRSSSPVNMDYNGQNITMTPAQKKALEALTNTKF